MQIISLDEQGNFEKDDFLFDNGTDTSGKGLDNFMFIAGIIFDDCNVVDEEAIEKERIKAFYRKAIEEVKGEYVAKRLVTNTSDGISRTEIRNIAEARFKYPDDLHSTYDKNRNSKSVRPVKQKISEHLAEFIAQGTYNGKNLCDEQGITLTGRKGVYHIFAILKSDYGIKDYIEADTNILANDNYAANRYIHMAGRIVNRLIFHNPLHKKESMPAMRLDIASRSTGNTDDLDADTIAEFEKQKYTAMGTTASRYYSIMNVGVYRTLIAQEIVNTGMVDVKINDLSVSSIKYKSNASNMEFLYLSDTICSFLGFDMDGTKAEAWLHELDVRINKLNPTHDNLLFTYDEIDNVFSEAWDLYERQDVFEALSIIYDSKNVDGAFATYYKIKWFAELEKRLVDEIEPETFVDGINKLYHMFDTSNLEEEKILYLMEKFESMLSKVEGKFCSPDMFEKAIYKLYDSGVSAYFRIGRPKQALAYYEKCKQLAYYADLSDIMATNNKIVGCLEDCFENDKAIALARNNLQIQRTLSGLKRDLFKHDESCDYLPEAKAIAQLAEAMSHKRLPEAEAEFRSALEMMENGSSDYKRVQSYLLHFYVEMDKQDAFEKEAKDYLDGRATYLERYEYVMSMGEEEHAVFSKEYALYAFLKGLYYYGLDKLDDLLWQKLLTINENWEAKSGIEPNGHPWEINYKYLQLLAIYKNDYAAFEKFSKLKDDCINVNGEIIDAINAFGRIEIENALGKKVVRDMLIDKLVNFLRSNFDVYKDINFGAGKKARWAELKKIFGFMYS